MCGFLVGRRVSGYLLNSCGVFLLVCFLNVDVVVHSELCCSSPFYEMCQM